MHEPPEQVVASALESLPEGAYVTSAVVIMSYVIPGEDDDMHRGPFLVWRTDTESGKWTHLGMVESAALDFRNWLSTCAVEEDED